MGGEISAEPAYNAAMQKNSLANLLLILALIVISPAHAGTWGVGKWGQMYLGSNQETAPTVAPAVDAQGDGTDIALIVTNLLTGQQVGWSAVTDFIVTCGDLEPVTVSASNPILTDLDPGTDYTCTIVAVNAQGQSPEGTFTATTDSMGGLPIWLLYQATQQS
jgi:hypothetical protein